MLNRTWLFVLALATPTAACKGPAGVCLNANCDAAVPVAVVDDAGPGGALRPGHYRFVVATEYASAEWTCALPDEGCDHDYFTDFEDDEDSGTLSVQARIGARGLDVEVLETRGTVWSGPARFTVQVERDGALVAEETFEPRYENYGAPDACAVCLTREGADPIVHVPE